MDNPLSLCKLAIGSPISLNLWYRACQKNVPIEGRFSATDPYAAILFSEHFYDKRYKTRKLSFKL